MHVHHSCGRKEMIGSAVLSFCCCVDVLFLVLCSSIYHEAEDANSGIVQGMLCETGHVPDPQGASGAG